MMNNKLSKILTALAIAFIAATPFAAPPKARAALLYTGSANQVVYLDETFVVEWYLDTQGKDINSLSLDLTYSKEKMEAVDASAGNSSLNLWIKSPEISQDKGEIKLIGGISGGLNDAKLNVFRATFKPKETGKAKISLKPESEALIADGQGTSAPLVFNEVNFTINPPESKPAQISSETHPDQSAWYKNRNATIKVQAKEGEQYSYSFSSNIEMFPDENPEDVSNPIHFQNLPDGIYYFKLNSKAGPSNWQEAGVYRVQIDTTPPREFNPTVGKDPAVFEGKPFVAFNTTDSVSGVQYYEVRSGFLGGWQRADGSYFKLPGLVLGDEIEVKVVDAAGNERVTKVKVDKTVVNSVWSNPIFWVIIVVTLIAVATAVRIYLKLLKKYKV